jgi:hypothetical protein
MKKSFIVFSHNKLILLSHPLFPKSFIHSLVFTKGVGKKGINCLVIDYKISTIFKLQTWFVSIFSFLNMRVKEVFQRQCSFGITFDIYEVKFLMRYMLLKMQQ